MKAKTIVAQWMAYMAAVAMQARPIAEDEPLALIFGMDEVKIDWKGKRIRIPEIGWVSCPGLDAQGCSPEWVAIYRTDDEWMLSLGNCAPFSTEAANVLPTEAANVLPTEAGIIHAVPACMNLDSDSRREQIG